MNLWPHQKEIISRIKKSLLKHKNILVEAPTASGKRVVFCKLAKEHLLSNKKTIIIVHTRELKNQVSQTLTSMGVEHGFICGKISETPHIINIAMIGTLSRRIIKGNSYIADYLIVDEAHHSVAPFWYKTIRHFKNSKVLGFTATPFRADGLGLGLCYDHIISTVTVQELIKSKKLSNFSIYAPLTSKLDLSNIKIIGGDYSFKELEKRVNKPFITGEAIEHYRKHCDNKSGLVFCISIKHAQDVAKEFKLAGIPTEVIWGHMKTKKRDKVLEKFRKGELKILTSVDVLTEGFDVPKTEAVIQLRPTYSLVRYMQLIGRGLRLYKGKKETIILDTVGNVFRFGFPDEKRKYSLRGLKIIKFKVTSCPKCHYVHKPAPKCPKCGVEYKKYYHGKEKGKHSKKIILVPGYLKKIDRLEVIKRNKERRAKLSLCTTYNDFYKFAVEYSFLQPHGYAKQMISRYLRENNKVVILEGQRYCGSCEKALPQESFSKACHRCKECQQKYRRKHYEKNKEKEKKHAIAWSKLNPEKNRQLKKKARITAKEKGIVWGNPILNKERKNRNDKVYRIKNKEKIKASRKKRLEKKRKIIMDRIFKVKKPEPAPIVIKKSMSESLKEKLILERLEIRRKERERLIKETFNKLRKERMEKKKKILST